MNNRTTIMIALLAVVMMIGPASAAVTNFTVTPTTTTAGVTSAYTMQLNTTGLTSLNVTIPAGYDAVEPAAGDLVARVDLWGSNPGDIANVTFTANSANPSTKVDVSLNISDDDPGTYTGTQTVSYSEGASMVIASPKNDVDMMNLTLPTATANGSLELHDLPDSIKNMTVVIYSMKNPTTAGNHTFVVNKTLPDNRTATVTTIPDVDTKLAVYPDTSKTANGEDAATIHVYAQDQYGNNVTTATNIEEGGMTPSKDKSTVKIGTVTGNGSATSPFTFNVTDTVAEDVTITAVDTGSAGTTLPSVSGVQTFIAIVGHVSLTPSKTSIVANNSDTVVVTAQLKDSDGNSVGKVTGVTWSVGNATLATVDPASGNTWANGSATATITGATGNCLGTVEVRVNAEGILGTTNIDLVVGSPDNGTSSVSPDLSATVGTTTTLTATIKDSVSHLVVGENVTFNVTALDGTVGSSIVTKPTNSTGVATATFTLSTTAGTNTINVCTETGDVNKNISITGTPDNATQLNVTTDGPSIASKASANIAATLEDQYGNPTKLNATGVEASESAAVNVTFEPDTTAHGTLSSSFALTTIVGNSAQASVTFNANETEGTTTITGSATGYTSDTTSVRVSTPDSIRVGVSPASIRANSSENATITVQLLDEFGDNIHVQGTQITFAASVPGNVTISVNGTKNTTAVTDANGTACANVTSIKDTIEPITITVMPDGLDMETVDLTITGNATKVVLSADPATGVSADGTSVSVITAQLTDDSGNNVAKQGELVTFGKSGGTLTPTTNYTNINGAAIVNLKSATAGTITVTGFASGLTLGSTDVVFTLPVMANMTVTATPDSINVSEATDITINVTDTSTDAPIVGAIVTLEFNSSVIASGTTVSGEYTATGVNVTETGTINVTVTASGYNAGSATVTVGEESLLDRYDANGNGIIDKDEAITAIMDYFDDKISKEDAIEVIELYFG